MPRNQPSRWCVLVGRDMIDFDIEVFYDGACPLCTREMKMLARHDRRGRIRFTDITASDFEVATYIGRRDGWGLTAERRFGRGTEPLAVRRAAAAPPAP